MVSTLGAHLLGVRRTDCRASVRMQIAHCRQDSCRGETPGFDWRCPPGRQPEPTLQETADSLLPRRDGRQILRIAESLFCVLNWFCFLSCALWNTRFPGWNTPRP